jgi:hypothetical protein
MFSQSLSPLGSFCIEQSGSKLHREREGKGKSGNTLHGGLILVDVFILSPCNMFNSHCNGKGYKGIEKRN